MINKSIPAGFHFIFPVLLFFANIVTKAIFITTNDIGLDEPFTIYHAQFPVPVLIRILENYNNPPLFEILLHPWIKVFGISPLAVRVFPMIFASLAPPALYIFARRHFSFFSAVIASLLLSSSNLLIFYAHDCRVYSLFLLLSILTVHFYFEEFMGTHSKKRLFLFILFSVLLIYSHYFGFLLLVTIAIHFLIFNRQQFRQFLGYFISVAILFSPQLVTMYRRYLQSKASNWIETPEGIESLYNMLWSFSNFPFVTVVCIVLLTFYGVLSLKRNTSLTPQTGFLLLWFLLPFLGIFFISFNVPMYLNRYLIFVLPAYYLLLCGALSSLFGKENYLRLSGIILVLFFVSTVQLLPDKKQSIGKMVAITRSLYSDSSAVFVQPFDLLPSFAYHYDRDAFSDISDTIEYSSTLARLRRERIFFSDPDFHEQAMAFKELIFCQGASGHGNRDSIHIAGRVLVPDKVIDAGNNHKVKYYRQARYVN